MPSRLIQLNGLNINAGRTDRVPRQALKSARLVPSPCVWIG
jgi:hypothetical protein